jgi:glycosyltransferase involved in cell wall biosynthesis
MRRIIYLNPFSRTNITGGIKTVYRQVELLCELGYHACVWQPAGKLEWLQTSAPVLDRLEQKDVRIDDVLVFPEVLNAEPLHPFMQIRNGCLKLLFCQNQHYVFNQFIPKVDYARLGFNSVFCPSLATKQFLEQTLHIGDVTIIPGFIARERFRPERKKLQILAIPTKMNGQAIYIAQSLRAKHADARDVPVLFVQDRSETEVARLMSESAILMALGHREAFGLVALEAMASGCLVAGFHGYGGLEYASPDNGLWFWADQEQEVVDALHRLIVGLRNSEVWTNALRAGGLATADRYSRQRTRDALRAYFRSLGVLPGKDPAAAL